jgi:hypothetical protein
MELFQKAGATSAGRTRILKEIVQSLVDFGINKEATDFLAKFPPDTQSSAEYKILQFQILNLGGNLSNILSEGISLSQKGFINEKYFEIMITRLVEAKQVSNAENYFYQAIEKFPKLKEHYEKVLNEAKDSLKAAA